MSRRTALLAVVLVALAGCVGSVPTTGDTSVPTTSPTTTSPTTTSPPTTSLPTTQPSYLTPSVECPGVEWIGFYGLGEFWRPDAPLIGFTLGGNTSVFYVAYVDGSVRGFRHTEPPGDGDVLHGDGMAVELDQPLSGIHTIRVVAHSDVNGNEAFEPETDLPCRHDGEVVQTGVERLNFTELEGTSTPERATGG